MSQTGELSSEEKYQGTSESGTGGSENRGRGGFKCDREEREERREYTNPLCQVEMTTGSSLRFELLRAGLPGPGAAYLI